MDHLLSIQSYHHFKEVRHDRYLIRMSHIRVKLNTSSTAQQDISTCPMLKVKGKKINKKTWIKMVMHAEKGFFNKIKETRRKTRE